MNQSGRSARVALFFLLFSTLLWAAFVNGLETIQHPALAMTMIGAIFLLIIICVGDSE